MKLSTIIHVLIVIPLAIILIAATPISTYQTQCISLDASGYISFKIWDTKKGKNYGPEQARIDAIHAILYSGIAGENGCITQKPLLSNADEEENFNAIAMNFFGKNGKWAQFTRSSAVETTLPDNIGTKGWKVYLVYVSKNELRKYLEEQHIINSLNNGF